MTTKAELVSWLKTSTARKVVLVEVDGVIDTANRNIFTYTEQFDNGSWTKSSDRISQTNALAPDGTLTADKLIPTTALASHYVYRQPTVIAGTTYTLSLYAKAAERNLISLWRSGTGGGFAGSVGAAFDVSTGTVWGITGSCAPRIEAAGNGWYRCSIEVTAANTAPGTIGFGSHNSTNLGGYIGSFAGDDVGGLFVWGAQLEVGSLTDYQRVVDAATFNQVRSTRYLSNRAYGTNSTDTPASTQYQAIVTGGVTFSESMDLEGRATIGYGDIELDNTAGILDIWLNWSWANKPVRVYIGDASWPKADFYQIFSGFVADIDSKNRNSVNLILADRLQYLNVPVTETLLGTVIGNNLSTQAQQNPVPLCFGECFNVTPTVIHTSNLIYQVHNGQIEDVIEVRDNGAVVPVTKDLGTGRFSLQRSPVGAITCSVQGSKWGTPTPVYSNKLGAIVKLLLESYGKQVATTDIDATSFANFDLTGASTEASIGVFLNQRENLLDLCQRLLSSVGAYLVCGLDGKFKLTQLKTGYTTGEQYSVSPTDMEERSLSIAQKVSVKSSVKLNYNKNWTPQATGLASGLKPEVVDIFSREYYSTTSTDSAVKTQYVQLAEPVAKDTLLLTTTVATAEATRLLNIYKTPRFIYKATYLSHLLPCELGDVIKLTHPRFGLSTGKWGTAVQIERDWLNGRVNIGILV